MVLGFSHLDSSDHPVEVEAHLLPLPLVPLLLQLRRLRRVRLQRRRDRRPETADVGVGAQAALRQLRQPALVLFQLAMLIKNSKFILILLFFKTLQHHTSRYLILEHLRGQVEQVRKLPVRLFGDRLERRRKPPRLRVQHI